MLWRDPTWMWLLAGVAAVAALGIASRRRRAARLRAFADDALVGRLAPEVDRRRRALRAALRAAALGLLVVALAGPKWGFHWEEVRREGIDLIIAVDTSRSMLATDVKPNRLERAKLAVLDLVQRLEGDRVGLVAFAGTAFLECPLTLDYAAFERSLHAVHAGLIPRGGTSLSRAIETSLAAFEARQGKHEALILITDGEDHEGKIEEAAQTAASRGVKIYTVGIGTSDGEIIPLGQPGQQSFLKDRQGQVVKSRLNEEALRQIALTTGAAYVRGLGAALGLDEVFRDHIAKMEKREVASTLQRRYEERFQVPLAIALVLLTVEALVADRKTVRSGKRGWWRLRRAGEEARRWGGTAPRTRPLALLLWLLMPLLVGWLDPPGDRAAEGNRLYEAGQYAEAAGKYGEGLVDAPASPLLQFNLGAAQYKQGQYAEAITSLTKVAGTGDAAWTGRAAYNLGNAQYRLAANAETGDPQAAIAGYEQALASYKRAMAADPQDRDAKFNHEFVSRRLAELKKKLEEQPPPAQEDQPPQDEAQPERGEQDQPPPDQEEPPPEHDRQEETGGEPEQEQAAPAPESAAEAPAEAPPETLEEQAAQAVIDTARSEELGPDEIQRQLGAAGLGEPAQDW